jgi:hypothetical protein
MALLLVTFYSLLVIVGEIRETPSRIRIIRRVLYVTYYTIRVKIRGLINRVKKHRIALKMIGFLLFFVGFPRIFSQYVLTPHVSCNTSRIIRIRNTRIRIFPSMLLVPCVTVFNPSCIIV